MLSYFSGMCFLFMNFSFFLKLLGLKTFAHLHHKLFLLFLNFHSFDISLLNLFNKDFHSLFNFLFLFLLSFLFSLNNFDSFHLDHRFLNYFGLFHSIPHFFFLRSLFFPDDIATGEIRNGSNAFSFIQIFIQDFSCPSQGSGVFFNDLHLSILLLLVFLTFFL